MESEWVETKGAFKDELSKTVSKRLGEYTQQLQETETMVKTAFHALTKASRRLWADHQTAQDVAETLKTLQENESTGETPLLQGVSISEKLEILRQLEKRVTELENGATCTDVFQWRHDNKLFISTRQPERTIVVTVNEGFNVDHT
ncbi:uncharacterized protein LOC122265877 [Penaeus japonicus]|uniref:uncharacterized protein LOC122259667 n=1 Tax=Penaeus japonicus TaxID=27405 RepID=UPI001C71344C|nr:uncharacterized protein LOC122259667 [Penaeus japonicus]XP_042891261.1 uncharacterized protein LOC122265877 [Penaeus japonicus]